MASDKHNDHRLRPACQSGPAVCIVMGMSRQFMHMFKANTLRLYSRVCLTHVMHSARLLAARVCFRTCKQEQHGTRRFIHQHMPALVYVCSAMHEIDKHSMLSSSLLTKSCHASLEHALLECVHKPVTDEHHENLYCTAGISQWQAWPSQHTKQS